MCILSKCGKVKSTAPGSNLRMEGRKVKAQVAFLFFTYGANGICIRPYPSLGTVITDLA